MVDRDDVEITYGSFDVHPPEHCNYYFRQGPGFWHRSRFLCPSHHLVSLRQ